MKKTINIALDYKRVTAQPTAIPALVAGDTANRMVITLTDAGVPVDLTGHKVMVVFSKVSDGTTVEQDTEDAFVDLEGIGIEYTGTPVIGSTITVTESKVSLDATTDIPDGTVTVSQDFRDSYPLPNEYVFHYDGLRWMYGEHSVKIDGNVVTVDPVKSGSYGNGKNNVELVIMKDSEIVTTAQFNFDGRRAIVNDETIQAQEKFPILVQLIQEVSGIKKGSGFMAKDEYDSNGDGIVNAADRADEANLAHDSEALGGHSEEYYATNDRIDNLTPDEIGAAVPAVSVTVNIPTDGWTASGKGFVKTVSVEEVEADDHVICSPDPSSFADWGDATMRLQSVADGSVTFYAESIPAVPVTANVMIVENFNGTIGGTGRAVAGGVSDVRVNGRSIVRGGVANITNESVETALGYEPADADSVGLLSESIAEILKTETSPQMLDVKSAKTGRVLNQEYHVTRYDDSLSDEIQYITFNAITFPDSSAKNIRMSFKPIVIHIYRTDGTWEGLVNSFTDNDDGSFSATIASAIYCKYIRIVMYSNAYTGRELVTMEDAWDKNANPLIVGEKKVINTDRLEIPDEFIRLENLDKETQEKINRERKVSVSDVDFVSEYSRDVNLIGDVIPNRYIKADGKIGSDSYLSCTDYIPIENGKKYYWSKVFSGYYAFYKKVNDVFVYLENSGHGNDSSLTNPIAIPQGAEYMRLTIQNANVANAWLSNSGKAPTGRIDYVISDNVHTYAELADVKPCEYDGMDICTFDKCICIGDSLTQGIFNVNGTEGSALYPSMNYPKYLSKMTGMEVTNAGYAGRTSVSWWNEHSSDDLSGYKIAIIQLGVNDYYFVDHNWTNASKEAFQNIINKVKSENRNIKVFVSTIIPAKYYPASAFANISQGIRDLVAEINDPNVILLDMAIYGHTNDEDAYNCGHLSAYGYWRLAKDYIAYIGWYMHKNPELFKEIQFIGTDNTSGY